MPEEIAVIAVVAIIGGTISGIIKQVISYKKARLQGGGGASEGKSLTTSELTRMLRDIVSDSTEHLERRFDEIDGRLDRIERATMTRALPPSAATMAGQPLLADEGGAGEDPALAPVRRTPTT